MMDDSAVLMSAAEEPRDCVGVLMINDGRRATGKWWLVFLNDTGWALSVLAKTGLGGFGYLSYLACLLAPVWHMLSKLLSQGLASLAGSSSVVQAQSESGLLFMTGP